MLKDSAKATAKEVNTKGGQNEMSDQEFDEQFILPKKKIPHLRPRFYIVLVHDTTVYNLNQIPPQIKSKTNAIFPPIDGVVFFFYARPKYK